jgi:hypothetical protein
MATTINTYLSRVKLIQAATLADLETAINAFMSDGYTGEDALASGEYVTRVDVDITTVRDVPAPVNLFSATMEIVGSTTTE